QHENDRRIGGGEPARLRAHRGLRHRHVSISTAGEQGPGGALGQGALSAAHHRRGPPPQSGRYIRGRRHLLFTREQVTLPRAVMAISPEDVDASGNLLGTFSIAPSAIKHASSLANGKAALFPSPTLSERSHRSLARRLVTVRRRAVLVVAAGQRP